MNVYKKLPGALLPWYETHKRDLPWRRTRDPYAIWVSEIMLQQTRVEAVKGYYARFLTAFPTVEALANADADRLHKLWEGLGYYSRVRNLQKAAQVILEKHHGEFPRDYADVLALPGIGAYTAGAVCSIAFAQPVAAVDGNVLRVISRLTENPTFVDDPAYRKQVKAALEGVYPVEAGAFTQALMELGATVCGPNRLPQCQICPCREFCGAAAHGTQGQFPVKAPKKERRIEKRTVFILSCEGRYAVEKRPESGLLAGLWQFPNVSGWLDTQETLEQVRTMGMEPKELYRQVERKHIFTHIQWDMRGIYLEVTRQESGFTWFTGEEMEKKAALPTAFRLFWEEIENV